MKNTDIALKTKTYPQPTTAKELILKLQEIVDTAGDIPVSINGCAQISVEHLPYYYDGGYIYPVSKNKEKSPYYKGHFKSGSNIAKKYPERIRLSPQEPDNHYASVNGVPLIEIDPDWKEIPIRDNIYIRKLICSIPYYKKPYKSKYKKILLNIPHPQYIPNEEDAKILLKQIKEKNTLSLFAIYLCIKSLLLKHIWTG